MSLPFLFAFQALLKIIKHQVGYISAFRENYVQGFLNILLLDCKAVNHQEYHHKINICLLYFHRFFSSLRIIQDILFHSRSGSHGYHNRLKYFSNLTSPRQVP